MNILYLTTHLNIGGISSYLLTLTAGMKQAGDNVYLASSGGQLSESFSQAGVNLIPIPIKTKKEVHPKLLISMFKLSKLIREKDIDIIHAHTRVTQVLGCLLQKNIGIPIVSTCHGFFKPRLTRRLFPCWGDKVIAISQPVKDHLIRDFAVSREQIRVVHNGIDVERFKERASLDKRKSKISLGLEDGPVVGIIARLSDVKGHSFLIRAMKGVCEKLSHAQLLIVGDGKMFDQLQDLVGSLQIEDKVKFVPSVASTPEALAAMDLFVMPSLAEGLGLGLMEAMAAGLCVVGSSVGGIKDLIRDGQTGVLVPPRDTAELSRVILELLQDKENRDHLGRGAASFIAENFSGEKMVQLTKEVYTECVS